MQRTVGYARVSTEDQRDKNTIQSQVEEIRRYCELYCDQFNLVEVYLDDGVSGTIPLAERPSGSRLYSDARAGKFEALVIFKFDRIARSARDLLNVMHDFDGLGVTVVAVKEQLPSSGPIRSLMLGLLAAVAEFERGTIEERTKAGLQRRARSGKWHGGRPPFGYDADASGYLVPREDEAAIVRLIFDLAANQNLSTIAIADHLNERGILNYHALRNYDWYRRENSGLWSKGQVSGILRDPLYRGEMRLGIHSAKYGTYTHQVEALVDELTWQQARENVERRTAAGRAPKNEYLLSGLMRCGECGSAYVGTSMKPKKRVFLYYECCQETSYPRAAGKERCRNLRMRADRLDPKVWAEIEGFIRNPGRVLERLANQEKERETRMAAIDHDLAKLDRELATDQEQRGRIITAYRKGLLTEEDVQAQLRELDAELATLREEREQLYDARERLLKAAVHGDEIIRLLQRLGEGLEYVTFAEKKEIARLLIRDIVVRTVEEGEKRIPVAEVTYVFEESTMFGGTMSSVMKPP